MKGRHSIYRNFIEYDRLHALSEIRVHVEPVSTKNNALCFFVLSSFKFYKCLLVNIEMLNLLSI